MALKSINLNLVSDVIDYIYASSEIYVGENLATEIVVEIPPSLQDMQYKLIFELPNKTVVQTNELIPLENTITYLIGSTLTTVVGDIVFQFEVYNSDNLVYKSKKYVLNVKSSIVVA